MTKAKVIGQISDVFKGSELYRVILRSVFSEEDNDISMLKGSSKEIAETTTLNINIEDEDLNVIIVEKLIAENAIIVSYCKEFTTKGKAPGGHGGINRKHNLSILLDSLSVVSGNIKYSI